MAYKLNLKNNPELARERKNAQNRAWYTRNRAKVLAAHKAWRENNPGYDAQYMRDTRELQQTFFNLDPKPILEVLRPTNEYEK